MSDIIVNVDPEDVPNVIIKVDENSAQSAIDAAAAAQLALSQMQNTDYGDLPARVLDLELPDGVVVRGIMTQVGADITVAANEFSVRKDQVEVFNPVFSDTIQAAADLYNRTDIFEIDTTGTIYTKQGVPDLEFFLKPSPTVGRYEIGLVNITGAVIGNVAAISNGYIEKTELSSKKLNGSGAKAQFSIDSEVATFRIMQATSIASVYVSAADKKFLYAGKDHYVKNETGTALIIKHNSGTGNYKYSFANATDLTIQNNEIVHFKFRFTNGNNGVLDYVGVASAGGGGTSETAETIKTKYESNADTNAFTDAEKTNLGNQSNTNTGDETATTLKAKIIDLIGYAAADETTPMTTGLKSTFRMPHALSLTNVRINTTDAPAVTSMKVDIKQGGVSIFSTLIQIDYGTSTSVGSAVPFVLSTTALTDNSIITIHVTQVGSGAGVAAGTGLKVHLYGNKS